MMIKLTELPEHELNDWFRELLRRGWIWLILADKKE